MPTRIKTHLIKILILPLLDYPPIPTHTLTKTQLGKLQRTQNKALRFATNQRYPYTMNTREIHTYTKTDTINVRLYKRALRTWERLELLEYHHLQQLKENQENIVRYNRLFPSSLSNLEYEPDPKYH